MATEPGKLRFRRGQAMMELAVGMFALALVIGALLGFTAYIVRSLDMHRTLRRDAGVAALSGGVGYSSQQREKKVELDSVSAEFVFGRDTLKVEEKVEIPRMGCE